MGKKSKRANKGSKYSPLDNDFEYDCDEEDVRSKKSSSSSSSSSSSITAHHQESEEGSGMEAIPTAATGATGAGGSMTSLSGLSNIGNTCYFNSCLQGMRYTFTDIPTFAINYLS